jgi:protoporphyrinogen/coproporphyrinogen III oxidase
MARFAVIGAGITGLAAAWELESAGAAVVVHEASDRVGGKLTGSTVPGLDFPLDDGADAFLARVPDALQLCAEIGLDHLVHPAARTAHVYARGGLHPLPAEQVLGVPTDLDALAASGLVSPDGLERARADLDSYSHPPVDDVSIGRLVRDRLGDEVCDHLVEPLLGGINAGEADGLSAAAAAPQIWALARQGGSLIENAARTRAAAASEAPVFATPGAGMASIPRRLEERLRAEIRTGRPVTSLDVGNGRVSIDGEDFAGAVVAVPARPASRLLGLAAPDAAELLAGIDSASVVMVTVVADRAGVDHPLDGSGFVVARDAGLSITACSWGSSKWSHWDDGDHAVLRVSLGHDSDPTDWCGRDDGSLVDTTLADLATAMGTDVEPVGTRVGRWPESFPQYRPGHLRLAADVDAAVTAAGPLAVAGSALGGIGVPACVRQGRGAARRLLG